MIIQEPTRLFVPNTITWQVSRADGTVEPAIYVTNARTDAGANAIAQLCGLAGAYYHSLSSDSLLISRLLSRQTQHSLANLR